MNRITRRQSRINCGISTIETLVVIMMLTVATSFAIFRASLKPNKDPARECAQCFVSAIRDARELSIKKQTPVTVVLDKKAKPVRWVFTTAAGSHGLVSKWELPVDNAATVDGTVIPIRFDDSGNASYLGEWKIRGNSGYQVTLEPIGAKVTLKALN